MMMQPKNQRMMKTSSAAALRLRLVVTEHQERMGKRIRERREELGLSRDEVARRMSAAAAKAGEVDKTNGNAIYRYELGEVTPGPRKLDLLAQVLKTQVVNFMMEEPAQGTPNLMGVLDNGGDQLDRVEAKLDRVLEYFSEEAVNAALAGLRGQLAEMDEQIRLMSARQATAAAEVLKRTEEALSATARPRSQQPR